MIKKIVITYKDNGPGINIEDLEEWLGIRTWLIIEKLMTQLQV